MNRIEVVDATPIPQTSDGHAESRSIRIFIENTKEVFRCRRAIITFSVGALQSDTVRFYPRLPRTKRESIKHFEMIDYTVVYIKWPHRFWEKALDDNIKYIALTGDRIGYWQYILNLDHPDLYNGSLIWRIDITANPEAEQVQYVDKEVTIKHIMEKLKGRFEDVPQPEDIFVTRWGRNRFVRGSYTTYPISFTTDTVDQVKEPWNGIYFIGSALSEKYDGYVHGAYLEGKNMAKRLLEQIKHQK